MNQQGTDSLKAAERCPLTCDGAAWTAVFDNAESNDEPTKPEDYTIVDSAYRMV